MKTNAQAKKKRGPIKILVIQLARLGDTLQTLMALRAAKSLYPELKIHLLVRENFSHAAKRVPWIEKVICLPTTDFLGPVLSGEKSEAEVLPFVAAWARPLLDEKWDFVVNWSYSNPSSFLAALIPAPIKLGYTRRKNLAIACSDDWSCYVQGVVQGDVDQNIHLTDILTTQLLTALQIQVGEPAPAGEQPVTSKGFFTLTLKPDEAKMTSLNYGKKWVALQLGAGQASKAWSAEQWAEFAQKVITRHPDTHLVLLGGAEDLPIADHIFERIKAKDRILSMVGKTSFDLWASIVSRSDWVIGGDTAVIHLASVLGTRVLNLSIGPVKWAETGPYGNSHYVIAPVNRQQTLSAQTVYGLWSYAATDAIHHRMISISSHFKDLGIEHMLDQVRIFRSRIRPNSEGGGVVYESIIRRPLQVKDWVSLVMGQIARSWYCGWVPPVGQELPREQVSPGLLKELRLLKGPCDELIRRCERGIQVSTQISAKAKSLPSDKLMRLQDQEELRRLSLELQEVEQSIDGIAVQHPALKAFSQMIKVMMHNLSAEQLRELGSESAFCYQKTIEGLKIFRSWLEHTFKLTRPVMIERENVVTLGVV